MAPMLRLRTSCLLRAQRATWRQATLAIAQLSLIFVKCAGLPVTDVEDPEDEASLLAVWGDRMQVGLVLHKGRRPLHCLLAGDCGDSHAISVSLRTWMSGCSLLNCLQQ